MFAAGINQWSAVTQPPTPVAGLPDTAAAWKEEMHYPLLVLTLNNRSSIYFVFKSL